MRTSVDGTAHVECNLDSCRTSSIRVVVVVGNRCSIQGLHSVRVIQPSLSTLLLGWGWAVRVLCPRCQGSGCPFQRRNIMHSDRIMGCLCLPPAGCQLQQECKCSLTRTIAIRRCGCSKPTEFEGPVSDVCSSRQTALECNRISISNFF